MSSSKSPFRLPEQPSDPKALDFDYAALDTETRIVVQQRTSEIKTLMRRAASDIFDIGQKLVEVKAKLGHGHFRSWLKIEFKWSVSTATRFMQVAEQFRCTNLMHLPIAASALYELAAPSTPIDARLEAIERASFGEVISYSKAKEIAGHYHSATEIKADQSVTIDVDALTVETESSAPIEQHQSQLPQEEFSSPQKAPSKASRATHVAVSSNQTKTTSVCAPKKGRKHLLDVQLNHLSLNVDSCSEAIPKPSDTDIDCLCTALLLNVEYLSHDQIDALWQVLAHRILPEKLTLSNWSDASLERLNAAALEELKRRHQIAQL